MVAYIDRTRPRSLVDRAAATTGEKMALTAARIAAVINATCSAAWKMPISAAVPKTPSRMISVWLLV